MSIQEVLAALQGFGFPTKEYNGTVQIEMEPQNEANKITRDEVHAAVQYKVNKDRIRQINPWTIIIVF